jgi:hypothetical protein
MNDMKFQRVLTMKEAARTLILSSKQADQTQKRASTRLNMTRAESVNIRLLP